MYPERVSNEGLQPGNDSKAPIAAPPATRRIAVSGPHFIPEFARRRPIRAVLLAAAVFAIPYSMARHQGDATRPAAHVAPRVAPVVAAPAPAASAHPATATLAAPVLPLMSIAMERSIAMESVTSPSGTSWRPPIGMDRTNEALDQLTMDFTAGPQPVTPPPASQTSDRPSPFPARARLSSPQGGSAKHGTSQPAPSVAAAAPAAPVVEAAAEPPAASLPAGPPVEPAAKSPAASSPESSPASAPAKLPAAPRVAKAKSLVEIDQYLWSVYQRSSTKRDSNGDFTWKDEAAAARLGLVTKQYVIGGMDPDFRTLLYSLGHAMDAAGLHWTILSGFRDDYRQGLASGYKAHVGNSFHGGSRATGGYGHGCAADIEASEGEGGSNALWRWVDQHGEKYGIFRPMKGIDPAHIQPTGGWHDVAFNIRDKRETADGGYLPASADGGGKVATLVDSPAGVSESQFDCVRSHRHGDFRLAGLSHRPRFIGRHSFMMHPRMHRFGRRRMVVDSGTPNRRADAVTLPVAGQAVAEAKPADTGNIGKHAKAEASAQNRRDARREKMADGRPAEKHPAHDDPVNTGRAQRDAKVPPVSTAEVSAPQVKAPHVNAPEAKAAEIKAPALKPPKAAESRHADDRHPQKHAAETPAHQAKAKGQVAGHQVAGQAAEHQAAERHVADHQDASSKAGNKKL
jgi:hypothetical protein